MTDAVLSVRGLRKGFVAERGLLGNPRRWLTAVRDVDLDVQAGETLGVVGESGSGKSTLGRCIIRLLEPDAGVVRFDGQDILKITKGELRVARRRFQMVFQDPYSTLNPLMTVGAILREPLVLHKGVDKRQWEPEAAALLRSVGMPDESFLHRYPDEFSGGQRQRISIARALAATPELLVLDEPTSALDVSIQSQVLNLLKSLQQEFGLIYVFISHDLSVVRHMCDRIAVMYLGQIVEVGRAEQVYCDPQHPYTRSLVAAVPTIGDAGTRERDEGAVLGEMPDPVHPPDGCTFHPRCPYRVELCSAEPPVLQTSGDARAVSCHRHPIDALDGMVAEARGR